MPLSRLQRFILTEILESRVDRFPRQRIAAFYRDRSRKPKDLEGVITKSLERLIDKELLVGYGRRTPHKWFIDELRLTAKGRRVARQLLGEQQQFALFKRTKRLRNSPSA